MIGQWWPRGPRSGSAAALYGVHKICGFLQLQELRQLDDRLLADIGASRREGAVGVARSGARKPTAACLTR